MNKEKLIYILMQTIKITGLYSFAENIKKLKIGDTVLLKENPKNRINKDAIGVYSLDDDKIGYIPFRKDQINIKSNYKITSINLLQKNPQILISREYNKSNIIETIPFFIKDKITKKLIKLDDILTEEIITFRRLLERKDNIINKIGITYNDDNYKYVYIETPDVSELFETVTRQYYEDNIFIYDELYEFKLIPHCIYLPYQIHSLESYITRKYKSIDSLVKKIEKKNIINIDKIEFDEENIGIIDNNIEIINIIIKYYGQEIPTYLTDYKDDIISNTINIYKYYDNLKIGGICYNHNYKKYCYIDMYNDENIIEIGDMNNNRLINIIIKGILSNKNIIHIYNPINGIIYKYEITEIMREPFINLF